MADHVDAERMDGDELAALAAVLPHLPRIVRDSLLRWHWHPDAFIRGLVAYISDYFAQARLVWSDPPDDAQAKGGGASFWHRVE